MPSELAKEDSDKNPNFPKSYATDFHGPGGCTINLIAFQHLTIFLAYQVIRQLNNAIQVLPIG